MNWNTIYITGRSDFRDDVRRKLEHADLDFMPGYVDNSSATVMHDLIWLKAGTPIRELKEAIGSKLMLRYRLRFYDSLEAFVESQNQGQSSFFTQEDIDMINQMRKLVTR